MWIFYILNFSEQFIKSQISSQFSQVSYIIQFKTANLLKFVLMYVYVPTYLVYISNCFKKKNQSIYLLWFTQITTNVSLFIYYFLMQASRKCYKMLKWAIKAKKMNMLSGG